MDSDVAQIAAKYRVVVSPLPAEEAQAYLARAPELPGCQVQAPTRGEALAMIEEDIAARLANMQEQGVDPPMPVDLQPLDGQLAVKVSPAIHRDLLFAAKDASVEFEQLLREVLTRAVSSGGGGRANSRGGSRRRDGQGRQRRGAMDGKRYQGIMENRAEFMEYVRGLEREGGGGGGRGGRGGGRRG